MRGKPSVTGRGAGSRGGQRFCRRLGDGAAGALSRGQVGANGRQPRLWHGRQHRRRRASTARTCSYATPTWWWARARSRSCASFLEGQPDVALVGPRVHGTDGALYPSARRFPDLLEAFGHGILGQFWVGQPVFSPLQDGRIGTTPSARKVDWVSGACFLARRQRLGCRGGLRPRLLHVHGGRRPLLAPRARPDGPSRTSRPPRWSTSRACRPTAPLPDALRPPRFHVALRPPDRERQTALAAARWSWPAWRSGSA